MCRWSLITSVQCIVSRHVAFLLSVMLCVSSYMVTSKFFDFQFLIFLWIETHNYVINERRHIDEKIIHRT